MTFRIKPLEWHANENGDGHWAYSPLTGNWKVVSFYGEWIAVGLGPFLSEQDAKDACYEWHSRKVMTEIEFENA